MKKTFTFKKILPSILIIAVFSISMFSALGVSTVNAQEETSTTEKIKLVTGVQGLETIGSGLGVVNDAAFGGAKAIYNVGKGAVGIISAAECLSGDGLRGCFAAVGEITLEIFGWILGLTGVALNKTVEITIIQMGANLDKVDTIDAGWKTFRDLANIIIIFSLLYIGIVTILNIEKFNTKKLLASLITAAILINFSMFFAKIIIDSSNLLATNFYKQIQIIGTKGDRDYGVSGHSNWGGISDSYMQAFRFTSLYKIKDGNLDLDNPAINMDVQGVDVATGKIVNRQAVTEIDTNGKPVLNNRQIIFVSLLGSIVFLITAFSFLAVTFLLIVRYAVLILLIMLSPIALAGMILPAMQKYSKMWWSSIISYAFFAPAYLLLTLIIIRMVNSEGFQTAIGFRDINTSVVLIIINFSIIIVLIIASIILSKQMGIWGSDLTIKMGNSARKWGQGLVGRPFRTAGRDIKLGAGALAESVQKSNRFSSRMFRKFPGTVGALGAVGAAGRDTVKKRGEQFKNLSTAALRNRLNMVTTSFADKSAINKILMDKEKGNPDRVAEYFSNLNNSQQKEAYINMSARNQVAFESAMKRQMERVGKSENEINARVNTLQSYLSQEDKDKRRKSEKEVEVRTKTEFSKNNLQSAASTGDSASVKKELSKLPIKQIKDLPGDVLANDIVSENLAPDELSAISAEGKLTQKQKAVIRKNNPNNPFFNTPAGKLWPDK